MPYFPSLFLGTLLPLLTATLSTAMSPLDEDHLLSYESFCSSIIEVKNLDPLYCEVLEQKKVSKVAWIIDVDGTITNEEDPSDHPTYIPVTSKGKSVENIKSLIQQKAVVVLCSAWHSFPDTLRRLTEVGFTQAELGHVGGSHRLKKTQVPINGSTAYLSYYQSGYAISVRAEKNPYFVNKAFSLTLIPSESLEGIEEVYFLDDNLKNHQKFREDASKIPFYKNKKISYYHIKTPI